MKIRKKREIGLKKETAPDFYAGGAVCCIFKKPRRRKMMKLRMTGFECSPTFVILRGVTPPFRDEARHWATKLVSVFQK